MFQELIDQGLVKQKRYDNGLSVFKYSREVFYKALWNTNPLLLEARGMVLADDGTKVIWPFTKVFNYKENNAGVNLMMDTPIIAPRKVNGFMAACRYWNGELIVSTTGSLDSDFAVLARKHIEALPNQSFVRGTARVHTLLFEICDPSDPHIVAEDEGAWLIGARDMDTFEMVPEARLDTMAGIMGALRPEVFRGTFGQLWHMVRECRHEGWMVIDAATRETVMKIKSPHYLSKKALMRLGDKKIDSIFKDPVEFRQRLDEEFYDCFDEILKQGEEFWKSKTEAERKTWLEGYFNGNAA
jgi:hypothetical protein